MRRRAALLVAALLPATAILTARADAQRVRPELRADAIFARNDVLHAGGGASVQIARSVMLGALGMVAVARENPAERGRLELLGRFLFDPDRRASTSVYAAGGVAALFADAGSLTGVLTLALGAEIGRGAWTPFLEAGLGGGVRVAAGVRAR